MRSVPASGFSSPTIMRKSVVLPAPFGPMTPTIPPRGRMKPTSSMRRFSPYALRTPCASITRLPRRGPGGIEMRATPSRTSAAWSWASSSSELAREGAPARRGLLLLLPEAPLLLLEPGGVVALPRDAEAAVQLQDPARDVVEEVAVVGDRHHRARVFLEVALEPRHRLGVEVVGGLVEEEHVGLAEEDLAERDAPALAPRERRHVGFARRKAERVHRHLKPAVELPGARGVDRVLHARLLGEHLLHLGVGERLAEPHGELVEAREQRARLGHRLLDVLEHVLRRVEHRLLRQVADADALGRQRVAREVVLDARHDPEQRRFARTVRAEHADLRARVEGERDALQDLLALRGDFPQVPNREDELRRHGGHGGSAARGEFPPSSKRASDVSGAMLSETMGPAARPTSQTLAYAGLSVATVGWAAGFVAGKLALGAMSPLVVAAWRYAVAAAILLPFALRQRPADGLGRAAGPLALMVVCGGVLYPWLFLVALSRTSATNTALLIALNPVLTLLFSPLVGERLGRRRLAGVLVALVGAATVITRGDPAHLAALSLGSGDPVALYVLGSGDRPWAQLAAATPTAVAGVVVMAVLSSVIAGQFFLVGVRTVGVGRTVVFVYLVPVLTALLSTTLLGEHFLPSQAVGGSARRGASSR